MQILHVGDAESSPAGRGRDEPNNNPKLSVPNVGRGVGAQLAGLGLSMPNIEVPNILTIVKYAALGIIVVMVFFFAMFMYLAAK